MGLTTSQYLRLICITTLPVEQCCRRRSSKKKKTKHSEEPAVYTINEGGEQIDTGKQVDQPKMHHQIFGAKSVDHSPDRSSLISDPASDGDIDDQPQPGLTGDEIRRWFKRGASLLEGETRVENLLQRIHNLEVYTKRWMRIDLERLVRSERQPERVISLDSDDEERE